MSDIDFEHEMEDDEHVTLPEYRDKAEALIKLRANYTGFFERLTEVIILMLMTFLCIFNTFYVPNHLREYQIPLIFRSAKANVWVDR